MAAERAAIFGAEFKNWRSGARPINYVVDASQLESGRVPVFTDV